MIRFIPFLLLLLLSCTSQTSKDNPEPFDGDDPVINAAYKAARDSVDIFIDHLKEPQLGNRYLVKIKLESEGHIEHLWCDNVEIVDGVFSGAIANQPFKIKKFKLGDQITAEKEDISDWVVLDSRDQTIDGGFTLKVIEEKRKI